MLAGAGGQGLSTAAIGGGRTAAPVTTYLANNAVFNVRDYAQPADANDAQAFQRAVNAAIAQGRGGVIRVPARATVYDFGATTVTIAGDGITLEFDSFSTYVRYSGATYAFDFHVGVVAAGVGPTIFMSGARRASVVCSNAAGSGFYMARGMYCFFEHCYAEQSAANPTGSAFICDGNGHTATNQLYLHCRGNGFKKQFEFRAGPTSNDTHTCCSVVDCFGNAGSLVGSIGVEFNGSSECQVVRGNYEALDYGVMAQASAGGTAPSGITLDTVRLELFVSAPWYFTAAAKHCCIINPQYDPALPGVDLSTDGRTVQVDSYVASRLPQLQITGGGSLAGSFWRSAAHGLLSQAVAGSTNDWSLWNPAASVGPIARVPTGTREFHVDNMIADLTARIPVIASANLPAWAAGLVGFVAWDTTNDRLVVYGAANRKYYTPGGTF